MSVRLLFALCLLISGCQPAPKAPPEDLRPFVAVAGTYALLSETPTPAPLPAPEPPAPSGQCENCRGTGKVGDGTTFQICPICKGSGVAPKGDLPSEAPPVVEPPKAPQKAASGPQYKIICENGKCRKVPIQNGTVR